MSLYNKGILCVDFDGTIVEHDFPRIGKPMKGAIETLKELKKDGWVLVLWTCRENDGYKIDRQFLKEAVEFCKEQGIEFDGINETPLEHEFRSDGPRRKAYGNIYIDDRNFGGFPGWDVIRKELIENDNSH